MRLTVENLSCGYSKTPIQRSLDFSLESGQVCCILGPNGCGKTTVFKTLLGILPPISGRVTIDGQDLSSVPPSRRAQMMGYVPQSHKPPFPYRVDDAVSMGLIGKKGYTGAPTREDELTIREALEDMGIWHLHDRLYTDVSGGELQLVLIARALVQKPQMLVLDEPTSALDYGNSIRVIKKVSELAERGLGIIMTTHDPSQAFMFRSKVLLLQRDYPMIFGDASDVINQRNMKSAYGIETRIVEYVNTKQVLSRMCVPDI